MCNLAKAWVGWIKPSSFVLSAESVYSPGRRYVARAFRLLLLRNRVETEPESLELPNY
jgi:hypothetical protein